MSITPMITATAPFSYTGAVDAATAAAHIDAIILQPIIAGLSSKGLREESAKTLRMLAEAESNREILVANAAVQALAAILMTCSDVARLEATEALIHLFGIDEALQVCYKSVAAAVCALSLWVSEWLYIMHALVQFRCPKVLRNCVTAFHSFTSVYLLQKYLLRKGFLDTLIFLLDTDKTSVDVKTNTGKLVAVVLGNSRLYGSLKGGSVLPYLLRLYKMEAGLPTELAASSLMYTASKLARDNRMLMEEGIDGVAARKLYRDPAFTEAVTGYSARLLGFLCCSVVNRRAVLKLGTLPLCLQGIRMGTADVIAGCLHVLANLSDDADPWACDPEAIKTELTAPPLDTLQCLVGLLDCAKPAEIVLRSADVLVNILQRVPRDRRIPANADMSVMECE